MQPVVTFVIRGAVTLGVILANVVVLIYLERKFAARLQNRLGPHRVGRPHGWLQVPADGLKLLLKEDAVPVGADRWLFNAAPVVFLVAAALSAAPIPISRTLSAANVGMGALFVVAASSLLLIAAFTAGWASNSKYPLISSMRAVCQFLAYEIPLTASLLVPVLLAGNLRLSTIVEAQASRPFILAPVVGIVAFVVFLLAALAEGNRTPFDVVEAESELVSGFSVEYSGMKFAYFYLAEYIHLLVVSAFAATLFLGGYNGPYLPGPVWLFLKTYAVFILILWIRWSFVRVRIDQLLSFSWRVLVPVAFLNLALAAVIL